MKNENEEVREKMLHLVITAIEKKFNRLFVDIGTMEGREKINDFLVKIVKFLE
jgi:hypothetical protein